MDQSIERATQLLESGQYGGAERMLRILLREDETQVQCWHLLGVACHLLGRNDEAVDSLKHALDLDSSLPRCHFNLGVVLAALGRDDEAAGAYVASLQLEPAGGAALQNLKNILFKRGEFSAMAGHFGRAVEKEPRNEWLLSRLGEALKGTGRIVEASDVLRRAVSVNPQSPEAWSRLLFASQYAPGVTTASLATLHHEWQRRFGESSCTSIGVGRSLDAERPLTVGFVSPDFSNHPVGIFLAPVLERLPRDEFQVVCYSNRSAHDNQTERVRMASDEWRDIVDSSDDDVAAQIARDGVDVLFDLAGHTDNNRLSVFARRAAPVQITWLGYVGTTGLAAIDYVFCDGHHAPPEARPDYSESMLEMPDGYVCYEPPSYAPPVGPSPALANGFVTFGSFNNVSKINSPLIKTWSRILREVATARLLLKYKGFNDEGVENRISEEFASQGVDADRVEMRGETHHIDHLDSYNCIDLALDTFPYSGGITTCESLWMGVPVITFPGATFAGRHSASHLHNAGWGEYVCRDADEFVNRAVNLASDLPALAQRRTEIRARMARSPLCDCDNFTAVFAAGVRAAWRRYAASH
ncbi:MAG: tetratricopeptide repeat protein [Pirellulaceae bacterium]|nr:tetratricopeptide repeat protein [Pirellulaceae bacterium]MDP7014531.1 tetratricopeptide repeat protein [Pirellulaceae bacterium]